MSQSIGSRFGKLILAPDLTQDEEALEQQKTRLAYRIKLCRLRLGSIKLLRDRGADALCLARHLVQDLFQLSVYLGDKSEIHLDEFRQIEGMLDRVSDDESRKLIETIIPLIDQAESHIEEQSSFGSVGQELLDLLDDLFHRVNAMWRQTRKQTLHTSLDDHVRRRRFVTAAITVGIVAVLCLVGNYYYNRPPEHYLQRIADLTSLKNALEKYHEKLGHYPVSNGWDGLHSDWGESKADWIEGLTPQFIEKLPRDPRLSSHPREQYLYRSDGKDFKLIAWRPEDCWFALRDKPTLVDRHYLTGSECEAYGFWTAGAKDW